MTYEEAVKLAMKLRALSIAIKGVELFGSVLAKGRGRDADFVILVSDELSRRWWSEGREMIRVRWPAAWYGQRWIVKTFAPFLYAATVHRRRRDRLKFSADLVGVDLQNLAGPDGKTPDFELFLMPTDWRINKSLNIDALRRFTDLVDDRNTLGFLKRIAHDAAIVA